MQQVMMVKRCAARHDDKEVCRLNWSEVKPRTQCRLEPSYIPVRKSNHQRISSDQAASQEAAGASPRGTLRRPNPRSVTCHAACQIWWLPHTHMLPCFITPAAVCRFLPFPSLPFPSLALPCLAFPLSLDTHCAVQESMGQQSA